MYRSTGVPHSYETAHSQDPTVGLCLGPYGGPRGGAIFYEQGTPVAFPRRRTVAVRTSLQRGCKSHFPIPNISSGGHRDSGDLWYKSGKEETSICGHDESWWSVRIPGRIPGACVLHTCVPYFSVMCNPSRTLTLPDNGVPQLSEFPTGLPTLMEGVEADHLWLLQLRFKS